jgi:hypothetical protein
MILRLFNNAVKGGESPQDLMCAVIENIALVGGTISNLAFTNAVPGAVVSYQILKQTTVEAAGTLDLSPAVPTGTDVVSILVFYKPYQAYTA